MPAFVHKKPRYTLREALELLGIGRTKFYELHESGRIESDKDGGRRYLTAEAIDRYVRRRAGES